DAPVLGVNWFPYVYLSQIMTILYFSYFILFLPLVGWFERPKPLPESISASVLKGGGAGASAAAAAKPMEKA
ncbi:MAG: hypothetical protein RLN80_09115, partial [Rhodospirillales bacterium]